ncbi:MAG: 16S rRNA (cytidine(1402)-2'-O)-methyltransferase [Bacilli bacterium]|nr:16S rRNA (cytidine(1402)-2'-O)-methyltransferase [Bacilli bacterium]
MRSQNFVDNKPLIYLVSTPIGNLSEFSPRAIEVISDCDLIACEDTRNTAKLLSFFNISKPLVSLREHNEVSESLNIIEQINSRGIKVVYVSDAGYPCISDPGAKLVELALQNGINVSTVSGPNAALNALVASGLPCDHFYFHGFLDPKNKVQKDELRKLSTKEETLIFYEAPHRIMDTLENMYEILGDRKACLARELTKKFEEFIRLSLSEMVQLDPNTLKGEMVVIVEGKTKEDNPTLTDEEIIKMVNDVIATGVSTKDAIKKVAEITNINKNTVYKIYHVN